MTYTMKELAPVTHDTVTGSSKDFFDAAQKKFGFVPNLYGGLAHHAPLLEAYVTSYNLFRGDSGFTPAEQEVVLLAVSRANICTYCIAAHSFLADKVSGVPQAVTDAIRDDVPVPHPKLGALASFVKTMVLTRGNPSDADVATFRAVGYTERHILGVILGIAVKTISNYSNHLFQTPLDKAFTTRIWNQAA